MKLTTSQLRKIIKEELENVLEGGSKKGWKPTMSKEETMENIYDAYGLSSDQEKQFVSWLMKNRDLGDGEGEIFVDDVAEDYAHHLFKKKERKLNIGSMPGAERNKYYANSDKMFKKMHDEVYKMLYNFGLGAEYENNNDGRIRYNPETYNAVHYGLNVPNEKMRAARATNKEPEFQTNPALEESRKRRTKRK